MDNEEFDTKIRNITDRNVLLEIGQRLYKKCIEFLMKKYDLSEEKLYEYHIVNTHVLNLIERVNSHREYGRENDLNFELDWFSGKIIRARHDFKLWYEEKKENERIDIETAEVSGKLMKVWNGVYDELIEKIQADPDYNLGECANKFWEMLQKKLPKELSFTHEYEFGKTDVPDLDISLVVFNPFSRGDGSRLKGKFHGVKEIIEAEERSGGAVLRVSDFKLIKPAITEIGTIEQIKEGRSWVRIPGEVERTTSIHNIYPPSVK